MTENQHNDLNYGTDQLSECNKNLISALVVKRSAKKKKKPPGRWGNVVNNDETIVNNDIGIAVESSSTLVVEDVSTCSKKLKLDEEYIKEQKLSTVENKLEWCYLLLDTSVLNDIVDTIGACPSCS